MVTGFLAHRNLVMGDGVVITANAAFKALSPVGNLATPALDAWAETTGLATASAPLVIDILFPRLVHMQYAGLFDGSFWQSTVVRLEAYRQADATERVFTTLGPDGRDRRVMPPVRAPRNCAFGDDAQFRGAMGVRDFALYPAHIHVHLGERLRVRRLRWTLWGQAWDRSTMALAGTYRIGHVWAGDGLYLSAQVGSAVGHRSGDTVTRVPGGGVWRDPGTGTRTASIERTIMDAALRDGLFDGAVENGQCLPFVWLPRTDDPIACHRYGGLYARGSDTHTHRYAAPTYAATTIDFEEWT